MKYVKEIGVFGGVALLGVVAFGVLGSDEGDAKESQGGPTTTTTEVPNIDSVSEGPYQKELLELAKEFDLEPYGGDWNFSLVLGEQGNTVRVKTGKGIVSLYPAGPTSGMCTDIPQDFIPLMTEPGDVIVWENTGSDLKLCPSEIFVVATSDEVKELQDED